MMDFGDILREDLVWFRYGLLLRQYVLGQKVKQSF